MQLYKKPSLVGRLIRKEAKYLKGEKTCSGKGSDELLGDINVRMEEL